MSGADSPTMWATGRPMPLSTIESGALLCGMDPAGTAHVILVDSAGRVVLAPVAVNAPLEFGVLGAIGFLLVFLGYFLGRRRA